MAGPASRFDLDVPGHWKSRDLSDFAPYAHQPPHPDKLCAGAGVDLATTPARYRDASRAL